MVIAPVGQAATHFPHLMQSISVGFFQIEMSMGQTVLHRSHSTHLYSFTFICNKLILLNGPRMAPMGQLVVQNGLFVKINNPRNRNITLSFVQNIHVKSCLYSGVHRICGIPASNVPTGQKYLQNTGETNHVARIMVISKNTYFI